MIQCRIFNGYGHKEVYHRLENWVSDSTFAHWNPDGGISYINGTRYLSDLLLDTEEDYLVCRLMFPEIVV